MISIVIITRNEQDNIGPLLDALLKLETPSPVEILVVDGASDDRTPDILREYATVYERVRWVGLPRYGFALQRNVGAVMARGEHVLYLSADVSPTTQLLQKYSAAVEMGYDVVQGTAIDVCRDPRHIQQALCRFRAFVYRARSPGAPADGSTVNLLIRRSLVTERRFDEGLIACEDKELLLRIHRHVRYRRLTTAVVYHLFRDGPARFWRKAFREALCVGQLAGRQSSYSALHEVNFFGWITVTISFWTAVLVTGLAGSIVTEGHPMLGVLLGANLAWVLTSFLSLGRFVTHPPWRRAPVKLQWLWMALAHTTAVASGVAFGYLRERTIGTSRPTERLG